MVEAGVFPPDDRIELIEGEISRGSHRTIPRTCRWPVAANPAGVTTTETGLVVPARMRPNDPRPENSRREPPGGA